MKYLVLAISLLLIPVSSFAADEPQHVMEVIVIDVNGNNAKYQELFDRFSAAYTKAGSVGERRMWGAGYAGPNTGSIYTTIEYPSMKALVESNEAVFASKGYQAVSADFAAAGMTVESRSILFNAR